MGSNPCFQQTFIKFMKNIIYTRMVAEGFQSLITPFTIDLDRQGLNLVLGENGEGKSTIFNAILWAEYGENQKNSIATWQDKRTDQYRGTRVVLDRTDGEFDYRIARHVDFKGTTLGLTGNSSLLVYKKLVTEEKFLPEHQIGSAQHKKDSQAIIDDQLGIDSNTYINSIIFGQRISSLIEADNKDKRELFDKLFSVYFVEAAKAKADKEYADLTTEIGVLNTNITNTKNTLGTTELHLDSVKTQLKDFEVTKAERIEEAAKNVTKYSKHINDAKTENSKDEITLKALSTDEYDKAKTAKASFDSKLEVLQTNEINFQKSKKEFDASITRCNNNISTYETEIKDIKDKCPTCTAPVKKEDIEKLKSNIKSKIQIENEIIKQLGIFDVKPMEANIKLINKCKLELDAAVTGLNKFDNLIKDRTELETTIKNRESNIVTYTGFLDSANKTLTAEKEAKAPLVDIKGIETKIKELNLTQGKYEKTSEEKTLLREKVEWWIKKGFGANGIKAFVFNAMLTQLNHYSYKYAMRLGFRVEFSIDMTKASKPFQTLIYSGDHIRDYKDLSGGQKQRVDICIAFAMHDLISQNTSFNIFVVDEMTEGLDAAGKEAMFEFIRMKSEDKAVYVITHLDIIDTLNANIIRVGSDGFGNTLID